MNISTHPLMVNKVRFVTNEMVRVLRLALDRIISRRPAVIFEGSSRVGKSMCAEFVKSQLGPMVPNAHVTLVIARRRKRQPKCPLLDEICHAENITTPVRVDPLYHLVANLETVLADTQDKQYVLIIDEIQNFLSSDYKELVDLHNHLKLIDIPLTVVGFSQPDIYDKRTGFQEVHEKRIVSRFLSEIHTFYGCRRCEDVTTILQACDVGSEFPTGSGLSYTAGLLPLAFRQGFRLASVSGLFWQWLIDSVTGEYINNLPMEYLCDSIRNYFRLAALHDADLFDVREDDVRKAVEASNLRAFCDVA